MSRRQSQIQKLVKSLQNGTPKRKAEAAGALGNLAANNKVNRTAIGEVPGVFTALVDLLQDEDSTSEGKAYAAGALRNLAVKETNRTAIGAVPGVFSALVALLQDEGSTSEGNLIKAESCQRINNE